MARLPARPRSHAVAVLALVLTVVFAGEAAGAAAVPQRVIAGPRTAPAVGQRRIPDLGGEQRGVPEPLPGLREAPRDERRVPAQRSRHPRVRGWDRSRSEPGGLPADRRRVLRSLRDQPRDPRTLEAAGPHQLGSLGVGSPRLERVLPVRARRGNDDDAVPVPPRPPDAREARQLRPHDVLRRAGGGRRAVRDVDRLWSLQLQGLRARHAVRSNPEDPCPRRVGAVRADRRRRRCPGLLRAVGAGVRRRGQDHAPAARGSRVDPRVDRDLPSRHRRRVPAVGGGSTRSAGPVVLALPVRPRTG